MTDNSFKETKRQERSRIKEAKIRLDEAKSAHKKVKTDEEFRAALKKDIEGYYDQQARNQIHDQIYHSLIEDTKMEFPTAFLKRWLQQGGEKQRTLEEAERRGVFA